MMSAKKAKKNMDPEKYLSTIINNAFTSRASDIHFDIYEDGGCVRLRIDGALKKTENIESDKYVPLIACLKDLCKMDPENIRQPQDGRMLVRVKGQSLDLRVSTVPTCFGESSVIRILSKDAIAISIERLELFEDHKTMLERWYASPC